MREYESDRNMCWPWYRQSSIRPCKHEVCWALAGHNHASADGQPQEQHVGQIWSNQLAPASRVKKGAVGHWRDFWLKLFFDINGTGHGTLWSWLGFCGYIQHSATTLFAMPILTSTMFRDRWLEWCLQHIWTTDNTDHPTGSLGKSKVQ